METEEQEQQVTKNARHECPEINNQLWGERAFSTSPTRNRSMGTLMPRRDGSADLGAAVAEFLSPGFSFVDGPRGDPNTLTPHSRDVNKDCPLVVATVQTVSQSTEMQRRLEKEAI